MKKPLRRIAALLTVCVLITMLPPVGLAVGEAVCAVPDGATLILEGDITADGGVPERPWIIEKNVTIDGGGHRLQVNGTGILLGADVTFRDVELRLISTDSRNAIIANGYALTLDNVTVGAGARSVNVFGGTLLKASYENSFEVPAPGSAPVITIMGKTNLQNGDSTDTLGAANIFAGSLSMGDFEGNLETEAAGDGADSLFSGSVAINIKESAGHGSLGTIYAGGGQQRRPFGWKQGKVTSPNPDKYRVGGTVTITGANALPDVSGAGADTTDVVYRGDGNEAKKTFEDISSLTVESGKLVPTLNSYFRNGGTLTLESGAKLDLQQTDGAALNVYDFHGGGGFVFLGQDQSWWIRGQVTGTTKVAVGGTVYGDANSQKIPSAGHMYIAAQNSQDGNFVLLPPDAQSDMVLERSPSGEWRVPEKPAEASKVQSLAPENTRVSSGTAEVVMSLGAVYSGDSLGLDMIPLVIRVNGSEAKFGMDADGGDCYKAEGLRLYVGDLGDGNGDVLIIYCGDAYSDPLPDGVYRMEIVVPGTYTVSGTDLSASSTLVVGSEPSGPISIAVPSANTGLRWTGAEQTGVDEGPGYTLSGHRGTDVGDYRATAALETGYQWDDGATGPKVIPWSIARADGPAAPTGLAGAAPSAAGGSDGRITGTTAAMEYASDANFIDAQTCGDPATAGLSAGTYYVRMRGTATHEPGAYTAVVVPAPGVPAVTGISIRTPAGKTEYKTGESLDVTGLTIAVSYSDHTEVEMQVTPDMVSGFDSTQATESQTLTITHQGHTAVYTVRITASEQPENPQHTHVWSAAWKSDATHHWHDCTASGCPVADNRHKDGYAVHAAGSWVVDRPATSTQSGVRHRSCTVCGYEMVRESIPAAGSSSGGSSSGGSSSSGSSSGSSATSVKNPDGSTTSTTNNKATGTVTETTRRPDGSKTVVETQRDGTVTTTDTAEDGSTVKTVARPNGTAETTVQQSNGLTATVQAGQYSTQATVRIPSQVAAASPGGVALPIPVLSGENTSVTVYTGAARPVLVRIPVYGDEATTVASLVNSDGSETILKTALLSAGEIAVSVPDGAEVHIQDNRRDFQDIRGHWARSAIDFVAARELFSGKTSDVFAPDGSMSRAMLATVLARLDGVDAAGGTAYQQGVSWAVARGISDGRNPDGQATREQFVAMLYRYAGSPAATNRELHFSDSEKISAYAREAMCWAAENGILCGYEDGSVAPRGRTTRAQAAALLARYVEYLNRQ